jgi:hypothetical protein
MIRMLIMGYGFCICSLVLQARPGIEMGHEARWAIYG